MIDGGLQGVVSNLRLRHAFAVDVEENIAPFSVLILSLSRFSRSPESDIGEGPVAVCDINFKGIIRQEAVHINLFARLFVILRNSHIVFGDPFL